MPNPFSESEGSTSPNGALGSDVSGAARKDLDPESAEAKAFMSAAATAAAQGTHSSNNADGSGSDSAYKPRYDDVPDMQVRTE